MIKNIRELIQKEKWEIKELGEVVTDIYRGSEITFNQLKTGKHSAIRNNITELPRKLYECVDFVNPELIKNKKYCECGDIVISGIGGTNIGRNCVYLGQEKCIIGNGVIVLKHNENPNFLSWVLMSSDWKNQVRKYAKGATVLGINVKNILKTKILIPPRHIQDVVADFLDKWVEYEQKLEKELIKELECRKKQYKCYRDCILKGGKDRWEG